MSESGHTTRRAFVQRAGLAVIALTACSGGGTEPGGGTMDGITFSGNQIVIDLAKVTSLASEGSALFIPSARTVVLRLTGNTFHAFNSTCTHQGCTVDSFVSNQIHCPCHGSVYDVNGQVVAGPAPRALQSYNVTFNETANLVVVTKA